MITRLSVPAIIVYLCIQSIVMRKFILFCIAVTLSATAFSQPIKADKVKLYNPVADAKADIKAAVEKANKEGKHVLLQIGGNWCKWCIRFNDKVTTNDTLKTELEKSYVVCHVNYSKENENTEVLASLGYPQRFGFPVLVVLDGQNNRLHTQDSSYLEEGSGHSKKKVAGFFRQWSPAALDPAKYAPRGQR